MKNKSMIITGGSSGIGLETVKYLSNKVGRIFVLDILNFKFNLENVFFHECDVSDYCQVKSVISKINFLTDNKIDYLFTCAGIIDYGKIEESSIEFIHNLIDTNLKGTIYTLKYVLPIMKKNHFGKIVLMGSDQSFIAKKSMAIYGATKAAISHLAKSTALDYSKYHIFINCICPGTIESEKYFSLIKKKSELLDTEETLLHENSKMQQPIGRNGKPMEVAKLVEFLISENSNYITGASIPIDGGYTAQ